MNRAPRAPTSFAERGATMTMTRARRDDRCPGLKGRIALHVLEVLLADEHRAHQRAEHDDPGQAATQKTRATAIFRSYSGLATRRWR